MAMEALNCAQVYTELLVNTIQIIVPIFAVT